MNKSLILKNKLFNFFFLLVTFFIFIYILYYLTFSNLGMINYFKLNNEYNNKSEVFNKIINDNDELLNKINKLSPKNIDLDYLEEISREKLGYLKENEVVIVF